MAFTEYTVRISDRLPEVMVHQDEAGKITRAYTYAKDVAGLPKKWIDGPSVNPLFVNLAPAFIRYCKRRILKGIKLEKGQDQRDRGPKAKGADKTN